MKTILITAIFGLSGFLSLNQGITGKWETRPSPKGNVTRAVFKDDNSFEVYINKKPFTTGTYSYSSADSLIEFTDNGCNRVTGSYKVIFFSHADSIRFIAVIDSCTERKQGMEKTVMGRVSDFNDRSTPYQNK